MDNLKRLIPYITPHKGMIMLGIVVTALAGLMSGAVVFLLKNVAEPLMDSTVSGKARMHQLNFYVVAILLFSMVRLVVNFLQQYLTQRTGQRILFKIREDLFSRFQLLSISFFEQKRTGEVMSRLTNDIASLQSILTSAVTTVAGGPIALVCYLGSMFYFNWRLSCFVFVVLPPTAWLINRAGRRIREATKKQQRQNASLTNYLQEKVSAMRLIQTFGTQDYENSLFRKVNYSSYKATMKPIRIQSSLAPSIEFVGTCGVVASLWFGGQDVIQGHMSGAGLVAFVFAMNQAAGQAKALANLNLVIKSADAAASRLWEIFDTQPEIKDSATAIELDRSKVKGHLKFEKVRFAYSDGPDVLHDVEFEIKPGQVIALAGLSGGGKSTIASLVPRLYDPTGGRITLDGLDLRDLKAKSLRSLIGAVPQDVTLFYGTLRDNIAYGTPNATLDQVVDAARRAHADEFIRKLPEGYDAPVGERGGGFSGGQRQRLAIARALLRDPKLLILDEATSALDAESEGLVQDALAELMKGRTTLIIAHRFSTIIHADQILVLDSGRIVESGTHTQLLAQKGQYHRLYQMQAFQARRGEQQASEETLEPLEPGSALGAA